MSVRSLTPWLPQALLTFSGTNIVAFGALPGQAPDREKRGGWPGDFPSPPAWRHFTETQKDISIVQ